MHRIVSKLFIHANVKNQRLFFKVIPEAYYSDESKQKGK